MEFVEKIKQKAKSNLKTIVLPEAEEERNLKAADRILSEGFAKLILIGNPEKVHHLASELYLENIAGAEIVDPNDNPKKQQYVDLMLKLRASKGLTAEQAEKQKSFHIRLQYHTKVMICRRNKKVFLTILSSFFPCGPAIPR